MENKSVLVCVTGQKSCKRLIVEGAMQAQKRGASLFVLHVARNGNKMLGYKNEADALEFLLKESVEQGADMVVIRSDDVLETIRAQARERNTVCIVAGRAVNYKGWDLLDDLQLVLPDVEFYIM